MQLTISSDDDLDQVLTAVGALFGVRLTAEPTPVRPPTRQNASPLDLASDDDDQITKTRH